MAIGPITKKQFESLQPGYKPMSRLVVEEREWFADQSGSVIGTVTFDPAEKDWGWVILAREDQGEFRVVQMGARLAKHDEARKQLRETMRRLEIAATARVA